jgi:hypothetical protein
VWRHDERTSAGSEQVLTEAREAGRFRNWPRAYELLMRASGQGKLSPADLELLAEAAIWVGDHDGSIDARQRAYACYVDTRGGSIGPHAASSPTDRPPLVAR